MNVAPSDNAAPRSLSRRISRLYMFLAILMTGIAIVYGYWRGEVTEQEATYFLSTRSVDSIPHTSLMLERSISEAIAAVMVSLLAVGMVRAHGWWGMGAMLVGCASSPVLMYLSSSATPDVGLVGIGSVMFVRLLNQPSMRASVGSGVLLFLLGITIHADLVLGGGIVSTTALKMNPPGWATSVVVVGLGIFTVVSSWIIGVTVEAWHQGKLNDTESRCLERSAAVLAIAVPVVCIAIGSIRLMSVFQYLERVDITLACAWIGLSIAAAQVWLRMPAAHFFPILLAVIAAKITWVHALGQERDLRQGSAVVARAISGCVKDHGAVLIEAPVDNVFRFTLYKGCARTPDFLAANPWLIMPAEPSKVSMLSAQFVGRFKFPDGHAVDLIRADRMPATHTFIEVESVR